MVRIDGESFRTFAEQRKFEVQTGNGAGRKAWLQSIADTGLNSVESAQAVGMARTTLQREAKRLDVVFSRKPRRPKKVTDEQVICAVEDNLTVKDAVLRLGVSDFTLRARAAKLGLEFRRIQKIPKRPPALSGDKLKKARLTMTPADLMAEFARRECVAARAE